MFSPPAKVRQNSAYSPSKIISFPFKGSSPCDIRNVQKLVRIRVICDAKNSRYPKPASRPIADADATQQDRFRQGTGEIKAGSRRAVALARFNPFFMVPNRFVAGLSRAACIPLFRGIRAAKRDALRPKPVTSILPLSPTKMMPSS